MLLGCFLASQNILVDLYGVACIYQIGTSKLHRLDKSSYYSSFNMALSMVRPRDRDGNAHKFGAKSRLNSRNQSPGMKSSLKHAYRSKVIGNLKEGNVFINVTRLLIVSRVSRQ